jgi:hypothetical protein
MRYLLLLFPLLLSAQDTTRTRTQRPQIRRDTTRAVPTFDRFLQPNNNLPFVVVKIKGKDALLLLDTGSSSSLIDISQLKNYGLTSMIISNASFSGIGGSTQMSDVTNINSIQIGTKEYAANFLAADLRSVRTLILNGVDVNITGILGSDFFEYHKVMIDYNRNTLLFADNMMMSFRRPTQRSVNTTRR